MLSRRLQILLTEGSSLSARQTLYALGRLGYTLDVCDPNPHFCLARFSRYVRTCYRCPSFAADPAAYLDFLLQRIKSGRYDVLFPTHDQIFLLARFADRFRGKVGLAVPAFAALQRLQSKAAFVQLLDELQLPHPPTQIVCRRADLLRTASFPCYVKLPYSTAGCGVWRVDTQEALRPVADQLEKAGMLDGQSEVLVQQPAPGVLGVVQSVFCRGRLIAGHCYRARALGVGGSARARVSSSEPLVLEQIARLGHFLHWHGALMLDYLHDERRGPAYIDANPRIGETLNATLSGVNLCERLVEVSLGQAPLPGPESRQGIRTHALLMSLLAHAEAGATRKELLAELYRAGMKKGLYAGSQDELTRPSEDGLSLLPAVFLALRLLIRPAAAKAMIRRTVNNYAFDEGAVRELLSLWRASGAASARRGW